MKRTIALFAFLCAAALLSACGGSDQPDAIIHLETDPGGGDSYTIGDRLVARQAGLVKINYDNRQPEAHDVAIEDSDGNLVGQTDVVKNGRATVTLSLDADETYTYFCTVANHRQRGQEGTLTFR